MNRNTLLPSWTVRGGLLVLALALLCALAFGPAARNEFVAWDDDVNFEHNRDFRGLGSRQIAWAWQARVLGVYQPLGWMLFEAEFAGWGLEPGAYHLVSILLHAVNTALLFILAVRVVRLRLPELARQRPGALSVSAALGAALFALHPLRVEVVAWASCQPYLPCVTCYLLALLAYLNYRTSPGRARGWLALSWGCGLAALLFKAVAVTLPAAVILLDHCVPADRRRGRWPVVVERLLFVVPAAVCMALALGARDSRVPLAADGLYTRIALAAGSAWFYGITSVAPVALNNLYPVPGKIDLQDINYLLAVLGLLAVSVGLWLGRRRWPMAWAAWLGYLVILAPSSGLVRSGAQVCADRYSYLPLMAVTLAAVGGVFLLLTRAAWGRFAAAAVALLLPVLVILSRQQCAAWHDTEALWRHNLAHGGADNPVVHEHFGHWLGSQARDDEALAEYRAALRLEPDYAEALHGGAGLLLKRHAYPDAEAYLAHLLELEPGRTAARCCLAQALSLQGKFDAALGLLQEALRREAANPEVHYQAGFALLRGGRLAEAVARLEEALRLDAGRPEYQLDLGIALVERGRADRALGHLLEAERLRPDDGETQVAVGHCLARLGRIGEAVPHLRRGVALDPASAHAHGNLGIALTLQGADAEARAALARAVSLDPGQVHFRLQLGLLLARLHEREGAGEQFREVLRLDPAHAEARRALDGLLSAGRAGATH